jgi:hypothetical protein
MDIHPSNNSMHRIVAGHHVLFQQMINKLASAENLRRIVTPARSRFAS